MKITKDSTLEEIIEKSGLRDREYMISPMSEINVEFITDEEVKAHLEGIIRGRSFTQLTLEDITSVLTAWNLPSFIDGLQFLTDKAEKGKVFYDIWDDEKKAVTGLSAFPLEKKSRFVLVCPGG